MNNEELKKKIVDILQLKLQECPLQPHGIMYRDAAEYGAYNAYSISLLTMPSFFIAAVSTSLLPEVSKFYV